MLLPMCPLDVVKKVFKECKNAVTCMNQKGGGDLLKQMICDSKMELRKLNRKINQLKKKIDL